MGYIGGAEVQQVILAKELKNYGFKISFITYDQKKLENIPQSVEGIKVFRTYYRDTKGSFLLLFYKIWCIWKAMKKADADLYYYESGSPGIVSLFCRLMGRKFIRYIASDANVNGKNYETGMLEKIGNWIDFKLADRIISQNCYQSGKLKKNYKRESTIIKPAFPNIDLTMPNKESPLTVLWVGRIDEVKQPQLFFELANAIPEARFRMIGGFWCDKKLYTRVVKTAGEIQNLEFLDHVPFDKIDVYYQKASLLVNTSRYEGFPNTFIHAWRQFTPTVTLVADPDEVICNNMIGLHSGSLSNMIHDVRKLLKAHDLRKKMAKNARQYFESHHDIKKVVIKYIKVFAECGVET
jgi:glycosyltransferase involved in cell wall biosynthesis